MKPDSYAEESRQWCSEHVAAFGGNIGVARACLQRKIRLYDEAFAREGYWWPSMEAPCVHQQAQIKATGHWWPEEK